MNGNIEYSDVKLLQLNTGNGKWVTNNSLLLKTIDQFDPDIIAISEANMHIYDNDTCRLRRNTFKHYMFSDKISTGAQHSRLTVMIKEHLEVQRLTRLENNINPSIVIKVKTGSRKSQVIIANYREWKGTSPGYSYNDRLVHTQL